MYFILDSFDRIYYSNINVNKNGGLDQIQQIIHPYYGGW